MSTSNTFLEQFLHNLIQVKTSQEFSKLTLDFLLDFLKADRGAVFFFNPGKKRFFLDYWKGFFSPPPKTVTSLPLQKSFAGLTLNSLTVQTYNLNQEKKIIYYPTLSYLTQEGINFIISLPLYFYRPLGVIHLFFSSPLPRLNLTLLNNLSKIISLGLGNLKEIESKEEQIKTKNNLLKKIRQKNYLLNFVLEKNNFFIATYFPNKKTFFPEKSWINYFQSKNSFSFTQFIKDFHQAEKKEVEKLFTFLNSEKEELQLEYRSKKGKFWCWVREFWLKEHPEKIIVLRKDISQEKHATITAQILSNILDKLSENISLEEYLNTIYQIIKTHLKTKNFFVALVDEEQDRLVFPCFIDQKDAIYEIKNISNPNTKSMTLTVIRRQKPLFLKELHKKQLKLKGVLDWVGTSSKIWLGVPLIVKGKTIGAMVIQDYEDPNYFTTKELKILKAISKYVALAIERKINLEKLAKNEQRLLTAIKGGQIGLWERDLKTGRLKINQEYANLLGYTQEELESKQDAFFELIHPEDIAKVQKNDSALLKGNIDLSETEVRMKGKDGNWHWILTRAIIAEYDEEGNPLTIAGTHINLDQLKKAEEETKKLQEKLFQKQKLEALATLTTGIAHDFNNLLQILTNNLQKLSKELPTHKNLEYLMQTCFRGQQLIKQIFNFLQEEQPEFIVFNLSKHIKNSLTLFKELLPKDIELISKIESEIYLKGVPSLIEHALFNLLKNSKEALKERGKITVTLYTQKEKIYLEVRDNGPGIPQKIQNKIFDPFFTTKNIGEGSGLGLASVYGIVKKHQGTISLHSNKEEGTTFVLNFPLCKEIPPQHTQTRQLFNQIKANKPPILLVEDEPYILEVTKEFLEEKGFEVLTAPDGLKALQTIKDNPNIKLVLLDLGLPKLGGEEVVKKLKELNFTGKILPTSGYLNHPFAKEPHKYGLAGFLAKPYDLDDLLTTLLKILSL